MFEAPQRRIGGLDLGEGPVWLAKRNALAFVDITGQKIHLMGENGVQTYCTDDMVGCVVPVSNGNLLAAVGCGLVELNLDTGQQTPLLDLGQPRWLRANDGKCDREGRLWLGLMARTQNAPDAIGGGRLLCVRREKQVFSQGGFTIPNGLSFCEDGSFYHTDTATGGIDLCVTSGDGKIMTRRRVVDIPGDEGRPDGFCSDRDGNLWVALWGGGKVVCIDPETGEWLHTLALPDKNVSCCCFGGERLDTLYITTARDEDGLGGNLYAVRTRARGRDPFQYRKD